MIDGDGGDQLTAKEIKKKFDEYRNTKKRGGVRRRKSTKNNRIVKIEDMNPRQELSLCQDIEHQLTDPV